MKLEVDNLSYGIIISALHYAFVYPIQNLEEKTVYTVEDFKKLYNKYSKRLERYSIDNPPLNIIEFIDREDFVLIISVLDLLIRELNDNDFYNLIQVRKDEAIKFSNLLKSAAENSKITSITSDSWKIEKYYVCPVCGYGELIEPPYTESGRGTYGTCPSCGFRFGVHDAKQGISFKDWRKKWIDEGMKWQSKTSKPPEGWSPEGYLKSIH